MSGILETEIVEWLKNKVISKGTVDDYGEVQIANLIGIHENIEKGIAQVFVNVNDHVEKKFYLVSKDINGDFQWKEIINYAYGTPVEEV